MRRERFRIAFLQDVAYDHLGVLGLVAMIKARGHDARVVIRDSRYRARLADYDPHLFAFSVTTGPHRWALAEAATLKKEFPGRPIVFGGPHATHFPEMIESDRVDFLCRGEGEDAIVELAERLSEGAPPTGIRNLWVKSADGIARSDVRPLVADLDSLPFPDRTYYSDYPLLRATRFRPVLSGRGCPFNCRFCHNYNWHALYRGKGGVCRKRSVENVCEELLALRRAWGLTIVDFAEDVFVLDRGWLASFAEVYPRRVGLPFTCNLRPESVDEEMAEYLRQAGCSAVSMGVETGSERLRATVLGKRVRDDTLMRAAERIRSKGIVLQSTNMLGIPGETLADGFATVRLNRRMGVKQPLCTIFQPYPRTGLADDLARGGLRLPSADDMSYTYYKGSKLDQPEIERLVNLHKFFFYLVRYPLIEPLVKLLIRLPPNPLFEIVFASSFLLYYKRRSRLPWRVVSMKGISLVSRLLFDARRSSSETRHLSPPSG